MVEAGGVGVSRDIEARNLLFFGDAKNAEHGKIAPNGNVSGTRLFHWARRIFDSWRAGFLQLPRYRRGGAGFGDGPREPKCADQFASLFRRKRGSLSFSRLIQILCE